MDVIVVVVGSLVHSGLREDCDSGHCFRRAGTTTGDGD